MYVVSLINRFKMLVSLPCMPVEALIESRATYSAAKSVFVGSYLIRGTNSCISNVWLEQGSVEMFCCIY